jgi:hypothetical protein
MNLDRIVDVGGYSERGLLGIALPGLIVFLGFVVVYDGVLLFVLFRKLSRYRATYRATNAAAVLEAAGDDEDGEGSAAEPADDEPVPADEPVSPPSIEWDDGRDAP